MKIAAVTDDGLTISQHFGRAAYYWVVTIEDGVIKSEEKREKMSHFRSPSQPHTDVHSESRHIQMIDGIRDCEVLLAGGMGSAAYESVRQTGIKPVLTAEESIDIAIQQYLAGILKDHVERVHR